MKIVLRLLVIALLSWPAAVRAQPGPPPLSIATGVPDGAAGTLTISGSGFGTRPLVTLDLVPLNIQLALDQRIIAVVPVEMIPPGSYLLTVSRGPQPADTASIDVRIGGSASADAPASTGAASGSVSSTATTLAPPDFSPLPGAGDAAARVADKTITMADIDREWARTDPAGYLAAGRHLYDTRRRIVTDMVNNELLAREAASRGMTVDALLKEELPKRTIPLPDSSVTSLYQSLGNRARGASLDQLRPSLREWLARKVQPELAKMTYIEELTKVSTRADIMMISPAVQVQHNADDPAIGPADAPVEIVLFGDFASPAYARLAVVLPRVRELFGARVRIVFKHFPANDSASIATAEAAACANAQGKFWPFHDTLLGEAGALDAARFKAVASTIGVNRSTFDACVDKQEMRERIGVALEETRRYDVAGSPSVLVNGRLAPDPPAFLPPFQFLKRLVEEELARQSSAGR